MLITIAGIKRSGSTAQFNMVRILLEEIFQFVEIAPTPQIAREKIKEGVVVICKYHPYDQWLYEHSNHIFTTERPLEEIKESMQRFYGKGHSEKRGYGTMLRNLRMYKRKSLNQYFKNIVADPRTAIEEISDWLSLEVDVDTVLQKYKEVKPPKSGHDPRTLLFSNHITK